MRKALVLLLLLVVATSVAVTVTGCGRSEKDKAMEYINKGDNYGLQARSGGEELNSALDDYFNTLRGPNPETLATPGGPIDQVSNAIKDVSSAAESADAEYQQVLGLKDAEAQKEYANMMIEVMAKTSELMLTINTWFNEGLMVLMTRDEGKIRAYYNSKEFEDGLAKVQSQRTELDKLSKEASEYRTEMIGQDL